MVAFESRSHTHANVKNLFPRGQAIGQKQVNALTPYIRIPRCLGQPMEYVDHPLASLFIQMIRVSGIGYWYDQQMTGIYRADVHKDDNSVTMIHHASWRFVRDY